MKNRASIIQRGFSLFELMIVLVIVSMIAAWTVPALVPAIQSKTLNAASDEFEQAVNNARQIAMAEDVAVDMEFIAVEPGDGGASQFNAYRFWKWLPSGDRFAIGGVHWLEGSFLFPVTYSTLLRGGGLERETGQTLEAIPGPVEIVRFSIYPNGETSLPDRTDQDNWHVTIASAPEDGELPRNFVCFQINQTNSHVTRYRP